MKTTEFLFLDLRRLFFYALCGSSGVMLDVVSYSLLVLTGVWYLLANLFSYALGTVLSFFLNRAITFGVLDAPLRRFASFLGVALIGFLTSSTILWALVEQMRIDAMIAKLITVGVVFVIQFSLNSIITFRRSDKAEPPQGT